MLGGMLQLSVNFPKIHEKFMRVKFAVQLCDNAEFS